MSANQGAQVPMLVDLWCLVLMGLDERIGRRGVKDTELEHGVRADPDALFERLKRVEARLLEPGMADDFLLQFVSGSTQAIARIRLENSWRNYYDINWRQRYVTILDFAR